MIPFNKPTITGNELAYLQQVISTGKFSGDGEFTKRCHQWFRENLGCKRVLLTTSCTHALEMCALLTGFQEGDEVIMPSFTFSSTAGAFALHGAKIVFVDVSPQTMNIDPEQIRSAITDKTRAIVVMHYAGVSCDMDVIMRIAADNDLIVVEDAAQAVMSTYKGKKLGTIGHMGCFSFHETKNIQCGEGGAILINDEKYFERAEILREKGTDRSKFFRGEVDKYGWVDIGSSYLPSELNASFLLCQLEKATEITEHRLNTWVYYFKRLRHLESEGKIELPSIPVDCIQNGHMFYIKTKDEDERSRLIAFLKERDIHSVFHYIPLHTSKAGRIAGRFHGTDQWTTAESERLLRLPLFYGITEQEMKTVADNVILFFS